MFVAIVGTRFSGKSTVEDYLVEEKGFIPVRLIQPNDGESMLDGNISINSFSHSFSSSLTLQSNAARKMPNKHDSFLFMSPLPSPAPTATLQASLANGAPALKTLCFSSPADLLNYVTVRWRENFVTCDLDTKQLIDIFIRRPFFMLVSVDAPLLDRFRRSQRTHNFSLEAFIREDDQLVFGASHSYPGTRSPLNELRDSINIHILNSFPSLQGLVSHLEEMDLLNSEHLRPTWDAYFMTLASLASRRSNCMKRRVGAVLVRDNRIIATGYNGTPRGLNNCNEGGCAHCNGTDPSRPSPVECVCLHAEENALLEAGRERIGQNAVLYCNTCPCLKCTVKIIQTGVKTVVYNLAYKMDNASAQLFKESGVDLRRYDPNTPFRLPPVNDESTFVAA